MQCRTAGWYRFLLIQAVCLWWRPATAVPLPWEPAAVLNKVQNAKMQRFPWPGCCVKSPDVQDIWCAELCQVIFWNILVAESAWCQMDICRQRHTANFKWCNKRWLENVFSRRPVQMPSHTSRSSYPSAKFLLENSFLGKRAQKYWSSAPDPEL